MRLTGEGWSCSTTGSPVTCRSRMPSGRHGGRGWPSSQRRLPSLSAWVSGCRWFRAHFTYETVRFSYYSWRQQGCRGGQCLQFSGSWPLAVDLSARGTGQQYVPRISLWRQLGVLRLSMHSSIRRQSGPCWTFSVTQAVFRSWCPLRVDIRASLPSCTPSTGTLAPRAMA